MLKEIPVDIPHPKVVASGHDTYGEWQIQNRISGRPLAHVWTEMSLAFRKQAIQQLATITQALHEVKHAKLTIQRSTYPQLDAELPDQIIALATQSKTLRYIDAIFMDEVIFTTKGFAQKISSRGRWGIVHNDLHFENILWDGQNITALLDFEKACYAPLDLELDLLLRFCAFPALFVHEEYEHLVNPQDYSVVPHWLFEHYPKLHAVEHLTERLSLYSLLYDLRLLQRFPPQATIRHDEDDHLINRIRAVVEQRSYISALVKQIHT